MSKKYRKINGGYIILPKDTIKSNQYQELSMVLVNISMTTMVIDYDHHEPKCDHHGHWICVFVYEI